MANKATASITRSREEAELKRPMIPLRFICEPAEPGTPRGPVPLYPGREGVARGAPPFCALWSGASLPPHLHDGDRECPQCRTVVKPEREDARAVLLHQGGILTLLHREEHRRKRSRMESGLFIRVSLTSPASGPCFLQFP